MSCFPVYDSSLSSGVTKGKSRDKNRKGKESLLFLLLLLLLGFGLKSGRVLRDNWRQTTFIDV
jgi:hypothetical protein